MPSDDATCTAAFVWCKTNPSASGKEGGSCARPHPPSAPHTHAAHLDACSSLTSSLDSLPRRRPPPALRRGAEGVGRRRLREAAALVEGVEVEAERGGGGGGGVE
eukprot:585023-Rhodomonas_salina.1